MDDCVSKFSLPTFSFIEQSMVFSHSGHNFKDHLDNYLHKTLRFFNSFQIFTNS